MEEIFKGISLENWRWGKNFKEDFFYNWDRNRDAGKTTFCQVRKWKWELSLMECSEVPRSRPRGNCRDPFLRTSPSHSEQRDRVRPAQVSCSLGHGHNHCCWWSNALTGKAFFCKVLVAHFFFPRPAPMWSAWCMTAQTQGNHLSYLEKAWSGHQELWILCTDLSAILLDHPTASSGRRKQERQGSG